MSWGGHFWLGILDHYHAPWDERPFVNKREHP